jgi:hypothetical protein
MFNNQPITKDDFQQWKQLPMTKLFFQSLQNDVNGNTAIITQAVSEGLEIPFNELQRITISCGIVKKIIDINEDDINYLTQEDNNK